MFEKKASEEERQYYTTLNNKVKSGDYINACIPNQYPRNFKTFKGFMFMFDKIAKDEDLGKYDLRILNYLLARLGFENWINITQQSIGDDLNIKQQNVSRTLKKLKDKNILACEKVGRQNFYKLNPEIAWRGKTSKWKEVVNIQDFMKKQTEQYSDTQQPF